MKYKVIKAFADLQDNKHVYSIGDEYPREGYSPTAERIAELSTGKNLLQKPLIQLIEEPEIESVEEQKPEEMEAVKETKRKRVKK